MQNNADHLALLPALQRLYWAFAIVHRRTAFSSPTRELPPETLYRFGRRIGGLINGWRPHEKWNGGARALENLTKLGPPRGAHGLVSQRQRQSGARIAKRASGHIAKMSTASRSSSQSIPRTAQSNSRWGNGPEWLQPISTKHSAGAQQTEDQSDDAPPWWLEPAVVSEIEKVNLQPPNSASQTATVEPSSEPQSV